MKNRRKNGNGNHRHEAYDMVTLHLVPVQARGDLPEGSVMQMECMDESGDAVASATIKAGNRLDAFMGSLPAKEREKKDPGVWFSTATSEEELDMLLEGLHETVVGSRDIDYGLCDVCEMGEPCEIWGPAEKLDFVPRPPPPPEVDPVAVDTICDALMDADEDGLAMETLNAAMTKFCMLKPRPAAKAPSTMTVGQAAEVLGVDLPCSKNSIDIAFKSKVRECHPDSGGSDEAMYRLSEAKRTLYAATEAAP